MTEIERFISIYNDAYDRGVTKMKEVADALSLTLREVYKLKETVRMQELRTGVQVLRGDLTAAARARDAISKIEEK